MLYDVLSDTYGSSGQTRTDDRRRLTADRSDQLSYRGIYVPALTHPAHALLGVLGMITNVHNYLRVRCSVNPSVPYTSFARNW